MIARNDEWRLVKNYTKGKFCFLIGANNWAIELQEHEFITLYNLLNTLENQLIEIKNQLLEEEFINLEIEKEPWYAELEGTKSEWSLRIVFDSNEGTRSFEMYWPIQIAKNLLFEIRKMWESSQ